MSKNIENLFQRKELESARAQALQNASFSELFLGIIAKIRRWGK